jgi:flagellar hook-length control protein FliK
VPAGAAAIAGDNSTVTGTDEADTSADDIAAAALPKNANVSSGATGKAAAAQSQTAATGAAKSNGPANAASTDDTLTSEVASNGAQSATAPTAATSAAPSLDGSTTTDSAVMSAATSGAAAQTFAPATAAPTPGLGTAPGATPDAATTLAAAGASASAAVAASAAGVITALAASTAVDEKHVRGTADTNAVAASTAGVDGSTGAGAAQATAGASSTQAPDPATANVKVSASVDSSEFGQGVANQIATMVDKNISSAKMQVNPPSLGPIEVRISVQGDHAQVWMVSHSAVTRDALQSSTPTLREMLNNQGFGQVSVDISQRSFQERTPTAQTYAWNSDTDSAESSAATSAVGSVSRGSSGVVDAYA